ncbi:MAG: nucleoside hydrolase [Candidatus Obscuribacterales bacterium]|nr:nucleoside hydrolase [Candidatus Obscuribacterales bacterium]
MPKLIVITDPGKALDDEEMLLVLSRLVKNQLAEVVAVVCNLMPSALRARLARGTLKAVGLPGVPVGVGTGVVSLPVQSEVELLRIAHLSSELEVVDGAKLLHSSLEQAADGSITLLLVSALTDAAALLHKHEALVRAKVSSVVIMGGVVHHGDEVALDADGYMTPDSAVNNHYDVMASRFLYRKLQEIGIPMTVLTRYATYTCKVPRALYQTLAQTGHPVGKHLGSSYEAFINDFWRAVNSPPGALEHDGLPARWNRELFLKTFCGGKGQERTAADSIIDLVCDAVAADPMALLAAIPELCQRLYAPHVVLVNGVSHRVIGVSPNNTGVKDREAVIEFLLENLTGALGEDVVVSPIQAPIMVP